MKKIKLTSWLILILISVEVQGQSDHTINVLQSSKDITLRQQMVDSIVNNSFWNTNELSNIISILNKDDFSESSKKTLLRYFDRSLSEYEKKKIREATQQCIEKDIEKYKIEAEKKRIPFETYFSGKLNELFERDLRIYSEQARRTISPLYVRILGWVNYMPAIPIIEATLKDSLKNKEYAQDNRIDFELNCKLALARMGNENYEKSCLSIYKDTEIDCADSDFYKSLNDLLYINTRNSINQIIKYSMSEKTYQPVHPDAHLGIILPSCSVKNIVLLYLFLGIINYPLQFAYDDDKELFIYWPSSIIDFSEEHYYNEQIPKLKQWLRENSKTYQINTERFFGSM